MLDDVSMNSLVVIFNFYFDEDIFVFKYNVYVFMFYNIFLVGIFFWYVEGVYKIEDNMNDFFGVIVCNGQEVVGDKFILEFGLVLYISLSVVLFKWGIILEVKCIENFSWCICLQVQFNWGFISFLFFMVCINIYCLIVCYNVVMQELVEMVFQVDVCYVFSCKLSFNVNYFYIDDFDGVKFYWEFYIEVFYKYKCFWILIFGVQVQNYNQECYEFKLQVLIVEMVIFYFDFFYKFDCNYSVCFEGQYMLIGDDEKVDVK